MNWVDGLKTRPLFNGGVYVLICATTAGMEIKLGRYQNGWNDGSGMEDQVLYYCEVEDMPADAQAKAMQISRALQERAMELRDQELDKQVMESPAQEQEE